MNIPRSDDLETPAGRLAELYAGIVLLAVCIVLGAFGVRGAILHLQGSRAAPADPIASGIGLIAGVGGSYIALRLLTGRREGAPLLPTPLLVMCGIGSLAGAVWFISINHALHGPNSDDLRFALCFGVTGLGAMALAWHRFRRRHAGRRNAQPES